MNKYLLILLLPLICLAQEPQITIYDFSGGLNTKAGIFGINPNQAQECFNINLSDKYRAIRPRKGYIAITDTLPTATPIYGIYGAVDRDGSKRLLAVTDQRSGSLPGLGYLVASPDYDDEIDIDSGADSLYPYVYTGVPFSWTTWQDDDIISNGRQVPIVVHNNYTRDLVVQAPGEPRIYPMNVTPTANYGVTGEFRYLIRLQPNGSPLYAVSYLSHRIKANNEYICLANFVSRAIDSTRDTTTSSWDSVTLIIYRCTANVETYDENTTMWGIYNSVLYPADAILDTLRIIDSIPDDSLGSSPYTDTQSPDYNKRGRLSDLSINNFRCGAPTYIGRNINDTNICLPLNATDQIDSNLYCIAYAITYIDTITGYESDTGRNLYIFIDWDTTGSPDTLSCADTNFVIGIPPIPAGRDHLIRRIWKSTATKTPYDTVYGGTVLGYDTVVHVVNVGYSRAKVRNNAGYHWYPGGWSMWTYDADYTYSIWVKESEGNSFWRHYAVDTMVVPIYSNDTVFSDYCLLATIKDSSIKYIKDTVSWANTILSEQYYHSISPSGLTGIVPFGNRAWGYMGSRVYFSYLDSGSYWSPFGDFAVNLDDGDAITAVRPFRDHIKIFKNRAQFILYQNDDGEYTKKWVVDGIGCIAPHSMVSYNNGLVYLSEHGVIYETGLIYKDKGSSFDIISSNIENLLDYTPNQHQTAVGAIKDNKYWLSYPDKDTTYVYDFKTGSWTLYNYSFSQAAFYDTVHSDNIRPAKDMLFIKNDDDRIFKADTGTTDDGAAIPVVWKSGALGISYADKGIKKVGFYFDPDAVGTDSVFNFKTYNSSENMMDSMDISISKPYFVKSMPDSNEVSTYFYIRLSNVSGSDTLATFKVNGMELWFNDRGMTDKE